MGRIYLFFQKTFILKRPGVDIVADIIKIVAIFINTIFKGCVSLSI